MSKHVLDTALDAPAADYFRDRTGRPAISMEEYRDAYNRRRKFAAHAYARFESWRFVEPDGSPVWHYYRCPDWDAPGSFYRDLELSAGMISSSDGWAPNRARFIYDEACAEQASRLAGWAPLTAAQHADSIAATGRR